MDKHAVQIVQKVGGSYVLNEDALFRILQRKNVLNEKVAVLTVAGAFRKGKIFFLSNCVRYVQSVIDGGDWMAPTAPVTGFSWRQSTTAVTEGILMWPEPFIVTSGNGEKIAVLLMDTEGAFDSKSSVKHCATVFALSALLSSVLVYNVIQDVQEDTLQHLQFFASYGSFALDAGESSSPFQSLLFLIRDWQNVTEFGLEAGGRHLDDILKLTSINWRSFADIKCALLPDPGRKITRGSEGAITVQDMEPDFRDQLKELIPRIFGSFLRTKEVGGKKISGAEFLEFFKTYVKIFASGNVPDPKSIYQATAEATHQTALKTALEFYKNAMQMNFSRLSERQIIEESRLRDLHRHLTNEALKAFNGTKKMGYLPSYFDDLKKEIETAFMDQFLKEHQHRVETERLRKEKEDAERRRIEQDKKAKAEMERNEREKEQMRLEMERARKEKEESEHRRIEQERKQQEEADRLSKQMEQMRLESEKLQAEHRRAMERERERREQAESAANRSVPSQMLIPFPIYGNGMCDMSQQNVFGGGGLGGDFMSSSPCPSTSRSVFGGGFGGGPSPSLSMRSGTPSGRPAGRPRGSVMDRFNQGILPREGTRDYTKLQRDGFL